MGISKEELLALLYQRGYKIVIDRTDSHSTVTLSGEFSKPLTLAHSYSLEWTDNEIRRDTVYDLLNWTGLKVQYTLDY